MSAEWGIVIVGLIVAVLAGIAVGRILRDRR